jgi:hypothetical protein
MNPRFDRPHGCSHYVGDFCQWEICVVPEDEHTALILGEAAQSIPGLVQRRLLEREILIRSEPGLRRRFAALVDDLVHDHAAEVGPGAGGRRVDPEVADKHLVNCVFGFLPGPGQEPGESGEGERMLSVGLLKCRLVAEGHFSHANQTCEADKRLQEPGLVLETGRSAVRAGGTSDGRPTERVPCNLLDGWDVC